MSADSMYRPDGITFCTHVSEDAGEDTAGTAWAVRRTVLVEFPLPWKYNALASPNAPDGLGDLLMELYSAMEEPWGFIGIAPDDEYSMPGTSLIYDLQQGDALAARYHRTGYRIPQEQVVPFLRKLALEPDHPDVAAARLPDDQHTRDLLLCTHGAVDACCATIGYPVYRLLRAMADGAATPTRVWRCTHFGGHRFAATAYEAPQGRYWGRLKPDMLKHLVHRRVDASNLRPHDRGWAALADPLHQVAEVEVLAQAGWGWLDAVIERIDGDATPEDGGTLHLHYRHPGTGAGTISVQVTPLPSVRTMHGDRSDERPEQPQYRATIIAAEPPLADFTVDVPTTAK